MMEARSTIKASEAKAKHLKEALQKAEALWEEVVASKVRAEVELALKKKWHWATQVKVAEVEKKMEKVEGQIMEVDCLVVEAFHASEEFTVE